MVNRPASACRQPRQDKAGRISALGPVRQDAERRKLRGGVHLFTPANRSPANRFQLLARGAVLRLAARPLFAPVVRRLLNREGERLGSS